jgi:hypothetical protein
LATPRRRRGQLAASCGDKSRPAKKKGEAAAPLLHFCLGVVFMVGGLRRFSGTVFNVSAAIRKTNLAGSHGRRKILL